VVLAPAHLNVFDQHDTRRVALGLRGYAVAIVIVESGGRGRVVVVAVERGGYPVAVGIVGDGE
jgi:hypothetical protein